MSDDAGSMMTRNGSWRCAEKMFCAAEFLLSRESLWPEKYIA